VVVIGVSPFFNTSFAISPKLGPALAKTLQRGKLESLEDSGKKFEAWVYTLDDLLKASAPFVTVLQLLIASKREEYIDILLVPFVRESCGTLIPTPEQPDIHSKGQAILYHKQTRMGGAGGGTKTPKCYLTC
jgi:hypothetical protein